MFFTKTARIIAFLVFGLAVLRVAIALIVAFGTDTLADNQAAARYFLGAANTGEVIDGAMLYIFVAVTLGVLSEISRNTASRSE